MKVRRRNFLLSVTLAAAAATPGLGQAAAPGAKSIPDFSGVWAHPSLPGFEPLASGPTSLKNRVRRPDGVSNVLVLAGDYTNPILKPEAAATVKKFGEMSLSHFGFHNPRNQCWPNGVPFVLPSNGMQMFQQPDKITMIYQTDHQVRHIRMNAQHPANVTPSWYGDSVGHYEGDTLVIDTVGIKVGPFAMLDMFGTPFTEALHVIERYRLLDYEAVKEWNERGQSEYRRGERSDPGFVRNPGYKGKGLELQFTVQDADVFTMPWSARIIYQRPLGDWPEMICAENPHRYFPGKKAAIPTADQP